MRERSGTSQAFPSLSDLVELAVQGKYDEVLQGLANRLDAADQIKYEQAVKALDFKTDNHKASWSESEAAGVAGAAPLPNDSEIFMSALITFAKAKWLEGKIAEVRMRYAPEGTN